MTGIGYNKASLAKANIAEPKSLTDLWATPADRLTFLNEKRDTFGLGLLKLGIDPNPQTVTTDDLQKVHDDIKPLTDKGLRFTGNEYLQDFASKKTWAAMTWSGDLASSGAADDVWVAPTEGSMVWTDNMVIPKGAANKYTAELMMNFVYQPKIAAQIANYVYYVSPVKGAAEELAKLDAEAAQEPAALPAGRHRRQAEELPVPVGRARGLDERALLRPVGHLSRRPRSSGRASTGGRDGRRRPRRHRAGPGLAAAAARRDALSAARAGDPVAPRLLRRPDVPDVPDVRLDRLDRHRLQADLLPERLRDGVHEVPASSSRTR